MNEFNPFETLGIDPNESLPSRTPLETETQVNPMETMGQFNPFKELNINVNGFEQPTADGKNTEVKSMLGIKDFEQMTDEEKQSYVDALSDEDWNTWNQLKSEGYSFEARKALMENQDMLYDISSPGTGKYLQSQSKEPITSEGVQRYIDWYQDRAAGFGERVSDKLMEKALYKKDGTERESKLVKGIGGMAAHILGKATELLDDAMNLGGHQMELLNNLKVIQGKKDPSERAEFDRTQENYKSPVASGTSIISNSLGLGLDIAYFVPGLVLNTLAQGNGPIARVINGAGELISGIPNLTVDIVANAMMSDPQVEAFIKDPANEGMLDDIKEGLTYAGMLIMGKYLKSKKGALGETKAGMMMNQFRTRFGESLKSAIRKGKEGGERAKGFNEAEGIEGTAAGRSNVRRATIEGLKQGRKEKWNQETPIEEQPGLPDTRITPYEEKPGLSTDVKNEVKPTPTKTNTDLAKLAEETKLSENNINNLKSNPDLQTEFKNTIKPYLEANGKSNPEGVISEPVNDLVYDIKAGIDELRVQQANLNRSINNKKLTPVEKALIKEIEKIINKKEPKQILSGLNKLTPAQKGILQRVIPNLDSRIQTINQILELTKEIAQKDVVSSVLGFFAKKPARNLSGYARKTIVKWIKNAYEQKGIQATNEAIDKFIDGLTEGQVSTIQKQEKGGKLSNSEKKSLSDILDSIKQEGEPVGTRQLKEGEYDPKKRDSLEDQGYTPKTRLVTVDKDGKIVRHDTSVELEMKPFTSDKPLREIFKEAGVNLTLTPERIFNIKYATDDVDGVYIGDYDLMEIPSRSVSLGILAHEFGHRVMAQLTENEKLKIIESIKKGQYNMSDKAANERFAEYFRNYFLYGNINGKTALEVFTTAAGQKAGQRIVNIMEKTKMDLFADLDARSEYDMYQKTKSIDKMIDNIYKLTEKGKEIINRTPEKGSRAEATKAAAQTYGRLEEFSKTDIIKENLTEIKNATNELKNIHVNEDGYIVGDFHSHETPVYDYIEDSNLPQELKDFLKKQEIKYLEEQDKAILNRLNSLNGD